MKRDIFGIIFSFFIFNFSIQAQLIMKRICFLQVGSDCPSYIICCDSDHDSLNEIIFERYLGSYLANWEVWEYRPINRYELVFADTGAYPQPPGITTGNFQPYDVGDIDRDSLIDLIGPNVDKPLNPDTEYYVVTTQESPFYSFYPSMLSWWYRFSNNFFGDGSNAFYFLPDLDNDNNREILKATSNPSIGEAIWENISNNQNQLVWNDTSDAIDGFNYTFGDFDIDSNKEFVTAELGSRGRVFVRENTGNNQYQLIWCDTVSRPNGSDVFSGNDLDGDGRPEFFVAFYSYPSATNYLYMWEATGNNTYQRTLIDQVGGSDWSIKRSICGDVDGDGIEELAWSIGGRVMIYKATGNNQFQRIWDWINNHGGTRPQALVNIYDMNMNGYNEIVISGYGKTSFFEVEAVRLLRPNGGETFHADSNDVIRWQKYYPPRCDSLSLFYSIDNGRTYQPIAHSLQPIDTSYIWAVPNVNSDSCKINIITYGPGWQYDESDEVFSITSTGIEEYSPLSALRFSLKVYPNPVTSQFAIRYSLPAESKVSLNLYNISGRLVKTLIDEQKKPGNYSITLNSKMLSSGVYFLYLQLEDKRIIEKLTITK